jgi:hypothetical protein
MATESDCVPGRRIAIAAQEASSDGPATEMDKTVRFGGTATEMAISRAVKCNDVLHFKMWASSCLEVRAGVYCRVP